MAPTCFGARASSRAWTSARRPQLIATCNACANALAAARGSRRATDGRRAASTNRPADGAALAEPSQVIVSPDGALNLIPFAALVDAQGRYLVESRTISYLTSGRHVVRVADAADERPRASATVVLADPQFEGLAGSPEPAAPPSASRVPMRRARSGAPIHLVARHGRRSGGVGQGAS